MRSDKNSICHEAKLASDVYAVFVSTRLDDFVTKPRISATGIVSARCGAVKLKNAIVGLKLVQPVDKVLIQVMSE